VTVAWASFDTPIGRLLAAAGERGVLRIGLPAEGPGAVVAALPEGAVESPRRLAHVRRQLGEYFAGRRRAFTLELDLSGARGFRLDVLEAMSLVPYGTTVTYSELAARAGRPHAPRAAGHACATNPIPIVVPCHRVVGSDGSLRGYTGGLGYKRFLLRLEGVDPDAL
jgi:methylated-DNA-[protein]-cysteine S-methyltransferase